MNDDVVSNYDPDMEAMSAPPSDADAESTAGDNTAQTFPGGGDNDAAEVAASYDPDLDVDPDLTPDPSPGKQTKGGVNASRPAPDDESPESPAPGGLPE